VTDPALLDELSALAPLTVVMGNCDAGDVRAWGATDEASLELGGLRVCMNHDSGLARNRRARMSARWPRARVVVFGHSHLPCNDDADGLLLFNPGSPTWKRLAPFTSMGILWIEEGRVEGDVFPV